jgi:hypothetical protein
MPLCLHYGRGDLVEMLDDLRERVLRGEIDILSVAFTGSDNSILHATRWVNDTPLPWARAVSAVSSLHFDLMSRGLTKEDQS